MISTQVDRAFRDWLKKAWEKDGVLRKASEKGRKRCGNQPASYVTLRIIELCGDAVIFIELCGDAVIFIELCGDAVI